MSLTKLTVVLSTHQETTAPTAVHTISQTTLTVLAGSTRPKNHTWTEWFRFLNKTAPIATATIRTNTILV